jgi:hypothetical protein
VRPGSTNSFPAHRSPETIEKWRGLFDSAKAGARKGPGLFVPGRKKFIGLDGMNGILRAGSAESDWYA